MLAGIAAADAACCKALGQRNRSQSHRDAVSLLADVSPGGKRAASDLARLLGVKDQVHYGFGDVSNAKLQAAIRQAKNLVGFAEQVLRR